MIKNSKKCEKLTLDLEAVFIQNGNDVDFYVHLAPGRGITAILGICHFPIQGRNVTALKISVKEKQIENKANIELIEFLSKIFSVAKSKIVILAGDKSRLKRINITDYKINLCLDIIKCFS